MPWKEQTTMSLRIEFVHLAAQDGVNMSELCRRFGISRKTGYKWLRLYRKGGATALKEGSRRPRSSPRRTSSAIEAKVLLVRDQHPAWGGRKIQAWLRQHDELVPQSPNTITAILNRYALIDPEEAKKHRPFQRFEMEHPNELWQMDFKGHFALSQGSSCHPLTVLDDYSRFLLALRACPNETHQTVQAQLIMLFRHYGLPERMLMDNGQPWGNDASHPYTMLTAWLIRLGVAISHGHPYHPQTQGKDERIHRTLQEELLSRQSHATLETWQQAFDPWRRMYNYERPHEALGLQPPVSRYAPSKRSFPEQLPPIEYDSTDLVRKVDDSGKIYFRNHVFRVGKAFRHQPVAIRPMQEDGQFAIYYCHEEVAQISLRDHNPSQQSVTHVPEQL